MIKKYFIVFSLVVIGSLPGFFHSLVCPELSAKAPVSKTSQKKGSQRKKAAGAAALIVASGALTGLALSGDDDSNSQEKSSEGSGHKEEDGITTRPSERPDSIGGGGSK